MAQGNDSLTEAQVEERAFEIARDDARIGEVTGSTVFHGLEARLAQDYIANFVSRMPNRLWNEANLQPHPSRRSDTLRGLLDFPGSRQTIGTSASAPQAGLQ